MPELPEVETIARQIRDRYVSQTIEAVHTRPVRIFQNILARDFADALTGKKLQAVSRYGKFLYWQAGSVFPVFHLGMSGIFICDRHHSNYPHHIHLSFTFQNTDRLYFQDVRKFSKIFLYGQPPDFNRLGLEPTNQNFTLNNFRKLLNLKTMNIKSLLMDQRHIAGIGNIYANEMLFDAGISPHRPANSLDRREVKKLYESLHKVLTAAIQRFGTTYTAYRTVDGVAGENQNFLAVYQRDNKPCIRCGNPIQKRLLNSRSTFYCKKCQR